MGIPCLLYTSQQYGIMFDAMVELFNEGKPVDLVTLQDRLKEKDVPPEVSSLDFVRDIITIVPTSANVKSYATIVSEKAVLRRLIKTTEEIANKMCIRDRISPNPQTPSGYVTVTLANGQTVRQNVSDVKDAEQLLKDNSIDYSMEDVPQENTLLTVVMPVSYTHLIQPGN